MKVTTCVLLVCFGTVLSQQAGQTGPAAPTKQTGPPVAANPVPTQNNLHHTPGAHPSGQNPADPNAGNPWHELLHRMMDLMTAASNGGPLPGDPLNATATPGQAAQGQVNQVQGGRGQTGQVQAGHGQRGPAIQPQTPITSGIPKPPQGPAITYEQPPQPPAKQPVNYNQQQTQQQAVNNNQPPKAPAQQPITYEQPPKAPAQVPMQQNQQPMNPKVAQGSPQQTKPITQPVQTTVPDCFWEGKFYRPGSDIVRGQHESWCYVTYCDSNGKVRFWDEYHCKPNSMKPTSTHSSGNGRKGGMGGVGGVGGVNGGKQPGCHHKGTFYEAGQEINQHTVGDRCYGTYCSHESQVVQWEDWCVGGGTTQPPTKPPHPKPGKKMGGGRKGGRKQGGGRRGGERGNGQAREIEGRRQGQGQGQKQRGGGGGRGGGRRKGALRGCYHNQLYYQSNEDVIVGNIGDMCYGYYCEGNNVFVHWEDRCAPTTPPVATTPPGGPFYFK